MSSELQQIESLLFQVLPDPRGFANRVLEQLLNRVVSEAPSEFGGAVLQPARPDNRAVAAALGACDCWGDDPDCSGCGGDGTPGWREPEETSYAEYVRPAVDRRRGRTSPTAQAKE